MAVEQVQVKCFSTSCAASKQQFREFALVQNVPADYMMWTQQIFAHSRHQTTFGLRGTLGQNPVFVSHPGSVQVPLRDLQHENVNSSVSGQVL